MSTPSSAPARPAAASEKVLLYYPTIDIPSPGWIRQGLMYWDKIGSIVPDSYDEQLPRHLRYSEQIQPLYDAKLFRPFNPVDLVFNVPNQNRLTAFKSELLEVLDNPEFKRRLPRRRTYKSAVYQEKVNVALFKELRKRKLVAEKRRDIFVDFEENTALVYMALLAKHLADLDTQYTVPSTDLQDYEGLNFAPDVQDRVVIPSVRAEFRDVLRVPADDVDIERVIDFRLAHQDELLHFRQQVLDKFEDDIKNCADKQEMKDKTVRFQQQLDRNVRQLDQLLKGAKFQTITGTLKAIFKPQHITAAVSGATGAGMATGSTRAALIAGVTGLAGGTAIELFDFFVSRRNSSREKLASNAYSYLYLAEQTLRQA